MELKKEEWSIIKKGEDALFPSKVSIALLTEKKQYNEKELSVYEFIKDYEKYYFINNKEYEDLNHIWKNDVLKNKKIKYISERPKIRNKSSIDVEKIIDKLLDEGINNPSDVVRILAWKTGKIDHGKSGNKIEYYNGWDENSSLIRLPYQDTTEISGFISEIIELKNDYPKESAKTAWTSLLKIANKYNIKGLGTVYLVTLFYFITKGEYPIFDRFAFATLSTLCLSEKSIIATPTSIIRGCN